jgi:heat shock protein HslJ
MGLHSDGASRGLTGHRPPRGRTRHRATRGATLRRPPPEPRVGAARLAAVPTPPRAFAALLIALLAASLAACSSAGPALNGREFLSVEVTDGGGPKALVAGTRIALRFGATDAGATAGCNGLGGTYRIELGKLLYEPGAQTAMGCGEPLEAQDAWLVAFLDSDPMIVLTGNELLLTNGATSIRFLDREVAEPDLNIAGPTWTVESLLEGTIASSVPEGASATMVFKADGTVEVDTGCNRGSGTWELEGAGIRIDALALTKMACQGPGTQLEGAVMRVLSAGLIQTRIEANVLSLFGGNAGLQLRGS